MQVGSLQLSVLHAMMWAYPAVLTHRYVHKKLGSPNAGPASLYATVVKESGKPGDLVIG